MTITDETRRAFHVLDERLPPEYHAELVGGQIIVTPLPNWSHAYVFGELTAQLVNESAVKVHVIADCGIETPHGNFIPDLTVVEPGTVEGSMSWGTPAGFLMLVEITSSDPSTDREDKRRAYAAAGVPLYLLVDRTDRVSILFSDPDVEAQDYQNQLQVPFGGELPLPAPFSFTLTDFTPPAS